MGNWWQYDMGDAAQASYNDPATAVQLGTMPSQLLQSPDQQQQQSARDQRGGLIHQFLNLAGQAGHDIDGALKKVGVGDINLSTGLKAAWYPVDKTASGAYWLYSNGVSQPLSTLLLMTGTSQGGGIGTTSYFSGKDWADTWKKANNISPGQAVENYENTLSATGQGSLFGPLLGQTGANLDPEEKRRVKQQQDKFIYDTNYWQSKADWKYTAGSGVIDFMTSMGLDPAYSGLKIAGAAVKGLRGVEVAGKAATATKGIRSPLVPAITNKITSSLAKTPDQISTSKRVTDFFDWAATGKSPAEISQHPVWGSTRGTTNPMKEQLSQLFSQADRTEMPLMFRFAMGDENAAAQLAMKNSGLLAQLGRAGDNRRLVSSVKFDPELFDHFMGEERAGRISQSTPYGANPIGGFSPDITKTGRVVEAPYPRPTVPGPRQAGWDAMYGDVRNASGQIVKHGLQSKANVYREVVGSILKSGNGVRPMGNIAANTALADSLRFDQWKSGQLTSLDAQIGTLTQQGNEASKLLGGVVTHPDDFSPGASNLFGSVKKLYQTGPLSFMSSENKADKRFVKQTEDRYGRATSGNFVSRTIQSGYYNVPIRVVQALGDQLPQTLVNHNADDASSRVTDMLKRVPGLGQDVRAGMVNAYSTAPDKIAKEAALTNINKAIVDHMAQGKNLNHDAAKVIHEMIQDGTTDAFNKLQGKMTTPSQMFSSAKNTLTGHRADLYEDGDAWLVAPFAKTQLSYSSPLLDVKELGRFLDRNSGYLQSIKRSGGDMRQAVTDVSDSLSNVWKATTLLRPGYLLRAPSDEIVGAAVKAGLLGSVSATVHGGKNFVFNRSQQLRAVAGKGSYASTIGGKTRLQIVDPAFEQLSKDLLGKSTRINVSSAWPVVMDRIDSEKKDLKAVEKQIASLAKDPNHDPADMQTLVDQAADHQSVIDEHVDYSNHLLNLAEDASGKRFGSGVFEHRGVQVPETFSRDWENPISRDQLSSDSAMGSMFARGESIDTARVLKTGNWTAITKDQPNYMSSLLDALNKQWAQDDLFKKVAGDPTLKTAQDWLKTPQGRIHMSYLGPHGRDADTLLAGVKDTLDHYTASNPVLQNKIARGQKITEGDIHNAIQKDDLPPIHGEEIKGYTRKGHANTAGAHVDSLIEKMFTKLGTVPTDVLSRNPLFARAHEAQMRQLMDQEISYQKTVGKSGALTDTQLNAMHQKAASLARQDIKAVVYDPKRTTATQALRFISPFFAAYGDGIERWAGLVAEQPQIVGRAAKIYNAPVAAHMVTNASGDHVDENGYATVVGPDGKTTRKFVGIQDRTIHIKMPPGTRGLGKLIGGGNGAEVPIKIQAMNTILPGDPWWNPGTGPVVSIAGSALAERQPAIGDFLQWAKVLPYGPQGFSDSITPAYVKNVWSAFNPDSDKFQAAWLAEYQRQVADHANGGPVPDMNKAEKDAKSFMFLKALTSWVSPTQVASTPLSGTKYQFYIDQYKKMQQIDPKTADDQFLAKYGSDYFIFATSLNKSIGIAPTLSALNTSKEYKQLIEGDPSLAGFIVGDVYNKGNFSSSAYNAEKGLDFGGVKARQKQSVQAAVTDNQRIAGWAAYGKLMNMTDANLIRAGFHSYSEKGAEQFLAIKQSIQSQLKQLYPAWEQDFDTTDKGALPRRIQSFTMIVNDPKLANDPMRTDIPVLRQYLAGRQMFKQALANMGAKQLSFGVTSDQTDAAGGIPIGPTAGIAQAWRAFQTGLVASNTQFGDVFNRYLSNDNLQ